MSAPTTGEFLNQTTPAAPVGDQTVIFQSDGATPLQSITAVPKRATGSLFGTVKPDGTTIVIAGGVITAVAAGGAQLLTANYTAVTNDTNTLLSFNSATAVTLTLPAVPPAAKWTIAVQNVGAGVLTVSRNGLLIDTAAANLTLTQNSGVEIYTDGTNYFTERGVAPPPITGLVGVRFLIGDVGNSLVQEMAYAGIISSADLFADVAGNAQISVSRSTASSYPTFTSIVASAPATLVSQQKNTSVPLTGWTLPFAKGDLFKFTLNSASTLAWVLLNLQTTRS
jgi:hypothetical protein